VASGARHFDSVASGYARTMAPSLRRVAAEVVRRARLGPGECVLDIGTGTGNAAALARGDGRQVCGIDAAPAMLEIARSEVPDVTFEEMDFTALRFDDASFDVVLAVHALLFAEDERGALAEWRRVTRPGGRLSLSVPGPTDVTPTAIYADIYERHGIDTSGRYPTPSSLAELARGAGWNAVDVAADPTTEIVLPDDDAFRVWRGIGSRGAATAHYTAEQHRALTDEMLAVTPRAADGSLRIPFGAIYLSARRQDGG
jgi:ubiquinone/menaquinone biosynthesis C-methylase UbiE